MYLNPSPQVITLKDQDDWIFWKYMMKNKLKKEGLLDHIKFEYNRPFENREKYKEWERNDAKAICIMWETLDKKWLTSVINCKTAVRVWELLNSFFDVKNMMLPFDAHKNFYLTDYKPNTKFYDYILNVKLLASKCREFEFKIDDAQIIAKLLNNLPHSLKSVKDDFNNCEQNNKTLDTLVDLVLNHEIREEQKIIDKKELYAWIGTMSIKSHMTYRKDWFSTYEPLEDNALFIKHSNDLTYEVAGIGSIFVKNHVGEINEMRNVFHVPQLKKNYFSLAKILESGFIGTMKKKNLTLKNDGFKLIGTLEKNGVYHLKIKTAFDTE